VNVRPTPNNLGPLLPHPPTGRCCEVWMWWRNESGPTNCRYWLLKATTTDDARPIQQTALPLHDWFENHQVISKACDVLPISSSMQHVLVRVDCRINENFKGCWLVHQWPKLKGPIDRVVSTNRTMAHLMGSSMDDRHMIPAGPRDQTKMSSTFCFCNKTQPLRRFQETLWAGQHSNQLINGWPEKATPRSRW
jgi:hypothetical protein